MERDIETDSPKHEAKTPIWLVLVVTVLNIIVVGSAIYIWGDSHSWSVNSTYQLFPLLGLVAFGLMWCHYVTAAILRIAAPSTKLSKYFRMTGYAVLLCILLHPGLLVYQLWSDGQGLPPNSYVEYVGQASKLAVVLGVVSLLCFLLYETKFLLAKTGLWPYIIALSDIAMIMIVLHALKLGSNLQNGWYRNVWFFYGVVLIACIVQRIATSKPSEALQSTAE